MGGNKTLYDFSDFKTLKELFKDIYYGNMTIEKAGTKQEECDSVLNALSKYPPKGKRCIEAKNNILDNAKNFYKERENVFEEFKNGFDKDSKFKDDDENDIKNKNGLIDYEKLERLNIL